MYQKNKRNENRKERAVDRNSQDRKVVDRNSQDRKVVDRNSTSYPLRIFTQLNQIQRSPSDPLQYHQLLIYKFLTDNTVRGILLYHEPGFGKTKILNYVAKYFADRNKEILFISAKTLHDNFNSEIKKTIESDKSFEHLLDKVKYVTYNSSNMMSQINKNELEFIHKNKNKITLDQKFKKVKEYYSGSTLEEKVVIIDEAHNFFNAICNGSTNAVELYDLIRKTKRIHLLFSSGSVITNSPFELCPAFNMLHNYSTGTDSRLLFPEYKEDFENLFLNKTDDIITMKNKEHFKNRIYGLVSYFGGMYFDKKEKEKEKNSDFPTQRETKLVYVPMSNFQFGHYLAARKKELEQTAKSFRTVVRTRFNPKSGSASYRVASRQLSNYVVPAYAWKDGKNDFGKDIKIKRFDLIRDEDVLKMEIFSPKMKKILEDINSNTGIGLLYSTFVNGEGLYMFSRLLNLSGYKDIATVIDLSSDIIDLDALKFPEEHSKYYAIISGNIDIDVRTRIKNISNSKRNMNGEIISLLMISSTGAEGLDLKNILNIYIMEPFFNYARLDQIFHRGVRFRSHLSLPEEKRYVQPYVYMSTYPSDIKFSDLKYQDGRPVEEKDTTDMYLYNNAMKYLKLNKEFLKCLAEASVDCPLHNKSKKITCMSCIPDDQKLFLNNIEYDLKRSNPCRTPEFKEVKVKEISITDADTGEIKKFYYHRENGVTGLDKITIFEHNKSLDSYVPVNPINKYYSIVYDYISTLE